MAKKKPQTRTRRANNEGSIYQRKDGLWVGMATVGFDENGKPKRKAIYSHSKLDVIKKLAELTNRISTENYEHISESNLSTLLLEWMLVFKKPQVTPRTFEGNMTKFKKHISPKIGGMKLDEITPIVLQKFLNQMQEENLGLDYVKKTKFLLRQFFEYAVDNNMILTNPVNKVKIQSRERKNYTNKQVYKAMPQEAREKFLLALEGENFLKPLCYVMMFAGLRTGEVLALTWDNVDFKKNTITVDKGMTNEPKFDENGNITSRALIVSDTKTVCSVRTVPMPEILVDVLKEYKNHENAQNKNTKNGLVFGNVDGSIRSYSGTKSIFERFLKRNNLKQYHIHFHMLRHTYSNMLFEAEQNPKLIQSLLGHRDVKTTLSTYNSIDKTYFDKATDVLNTRYDEYKKKQTEELYDQIEDDDLDLLLENLQKQKEKRKHKNKDFEM